MFDRIPEDWRLLERFSDAAVADADAGLVRPFDRGDYGRHPTRTTGSPVDDPVTFTDYVESPDGLGSSGPSTFGLGLAQGADTTPPARSTARTPRRSAASTC